MKRSGLMVRGNLELAIMAVTVLMPTSEFANGQTFRHKAMGISIYDQNGQLAPNAEPSATSQIFDVIVGPTGMEFTFSPATVTISVGDTIRWTWQSDFHSVTSGLANSCTADGQFCSPDDVNCDLSDQGTVYMHTFNQPGTYSYFCLAHCDFGMTGTVTVTGAAPLQLTTAVSRKTHGAAGTFDINLPLSGTPGLESRTGDYTIVATFTNAVVSGNASVTSGVGTVNGSPVFSGNTMTVSLTGVATAQTLTVTLSNVTDVFSQVLPGTPISMSVLIGDANANGTVNAADVLLTKSQLGQNVTASNFREDPNANGVINSADVAIVKSHLGQGIP